MEKNYNFSPDVFNTILRTTKEAEQFIWHINTVRQSVFMSSEKRREVLEEQMPYTTKQVIIDLCASNHVSLDNAQEAATFLQAVEEKVKSLPTITITLAIIPSERLLQVLTTWFYQSYNTQILLDIIYDPSILGGLQMAIDGRIHDYSLRRYIPQ